MTGKQATVLVSRLERRGLSKADVASRIHCTVATIYGWASNPERRLTRAIGTNLSALWEEVRNAE